MDSSSDFDDLPYVVWYQCRMCTHLYFDDVEKMFSHLDTKHGAMIDCDELREIVYKNGLAMGGLPRVPKVGKNENGDNDDDDDKKISEPSPSALEIAENIQEELLMKRDADLPASSNKVQALDKEEEEYEENGDYENGYEDSTYQNDNEEDGYYEENQNGHDDSQEKQLCVEQKFVQNMEEDEHEDYEEYDNDYENGNHIDTHLNDKLLQSPNMEDGEQYDHDELVTGDYDDEHEEGEIPAEVSMNEDDSEDQGYDQDEFGLEENGENGSAPRNGKPAPGVMNYGYSCRFCGKFFTTRRGVESHEQHHKNQVSTHTIVVGKRHDPKVFRCQICPQILPSFKDLKAHVKAHTTDRIHICKFCFALFNNTASLTKHLTIHNRENPNKCFCGKTFVSANTLKIHKKIHTGIKPFVCDYYQCGRAFVTKSTLESHLRTHTGEKPYQCSYCASSFTTSSAKYRHERHVHKVFDPEPETVAT